MEEGNLDEWYAYDCGDIYNTLDGDTVASRDRAHTGDWSAKMSISATSDASETSATRLKIGGPLPGQRGGRIWDSPIEIPVGR